MTKGAFKDNDVVRVLTTVEARTFDDEAQKVILPAGSRGTVISVYGNAESPSEYLIEFYLKEIQYWGDALVPAELVESDN